MQFFEGYGLWKIFSLLMKFKGQKIYEKQFPTILNNFYGKSGLGKHSIFEKWRDFEKWREEKILQRLWPLQNWHFGFEQKIYEKQFAKDTKKVLKF